MFIVQFAGKEVRLQTVIVPDMVDCGIRGMEPGVALWTEDGNGEPVITGDEKLDSFLRECMTYNVNEGFGHEEPTKGSIDGLETIYWEYIPEKGE